MTITYEGRPCSKFSEHGGLRYRSNNVCVACSKRASREWRAAHRKTPEGIGNRGVLFIIKQQEFERAIAVGDIPPDIARLEGNDRDRAINVWWHFRRANDPAFAAETRRRGLLSNDDEILAAGTADNLPSWAGYETPSKFSPHIPKMPIAPQFQYTGDHGSDRYTGQGNYGAAPSCNVQAASKAAGFKPSVIYGRMYRNKCSFEEAIAQGPATPHERLLTHDNKTLSVSEWGRVTGLGYSLIKIRLDKLGWSVEKALTTPVHTARGAP